MASQHFTRRQVGAGAAALFAWAHAPKLAHSAGARDPRLLVVVLRGALDGLAATPAIGDPQYALIRERLALSASGERPAHPLDGFFFMHPAMPHAARLFREKKLSIVHAVATPYRERSHFDGQDVLESGFVRPGASRTGWLNRLLMALPKGDAVRPPSGLAVGVTTPLVLRGPAPVLAWSPPGEFAASRDLFERVLDIYVHTDPELASALAKTLETEHMAAEQGLDARFNTSKKSQADGFRSVAASAARFLVRPDGPRIAALSYDGFDTHAHEGAAAGRLPDLLGSLDAALQSFEAELAPIWQDTVVVFVTEFGRAARVNGTLGTDHGNGTVAFLTGGAVAGGRVIADWPGLAPNQLLEGRDLMPTTDLRAVLKGVIAGLFDVSPKVLADEIFPSSESAPPMRDLIV